MRPTLCLLHAFPLSAEMFAGQRAALADVADVVTPNLPGFGGTAPLSPSTIDGMARSVEQALAGRDPRAPLVVGGVSMGGYVALAFARQFARELAGLVLIDTRAEPDDDTARAGRDRNIALVREKGLEPLIEAMLPRLLGETTRRDRPDVVEQVRRLAQTQSPEGVVAGLEALRDRADARPALPGIIVPTLLLYGAEDQLTPPSVGESLAATLKGQLVVIPRAGHLPNLETPTEFNTALRTFLKR